MLHRAMLFQSRDHLSNARPFLTNGDVNADEVFALLVDDGVNGHGGLAGLAVTDDQLTLSATNRDHGVDGLDSSLHRRIHALAHSPH